MVLPNKLPYEIDKSRIQNKIFDEKHIVKIPFLNPEKNVEKFAIFIKEPQSGIRPYLVQRYITLNTKDGDGVYCIADVRNTSFFSVEVINGLVKKAYKFKNTSAESQPELTVAKFQKSEIEISESLSLTDPTHGYFIGTLNFFSRLGCWLMGGTVISMDYSIDYKGFCDLTTSNNGSPENTNTSQFQSFQNFITAIVQSAGATTGTNWSSGFTLPSYGGGGGAIFNSNSFEVANAFVNQMQFDSRFLESDIQKIKYGMVALYQYNINHPSEYDNMTIDQLHNAYKNSTNKAFFPIYKMILRAGVNAIADAGIQMVIKWLQNEDPNYGLLDSFKDITWRSVGLSALEGGFFGNTNFLVRNLGTALADTLMQVVSDIWQGKEINAFDFINHFSNKFLEFATADILGELGSNIIMDKIVKGLFSKANQKVAWIKQYFGYNYDNICKLYGAAGLQNILIQYSLNGTLLKSVRQVKGWATNKVAIIGNGMDRVTAFATKHKQVNPSLEVVTFNDDWILNYLDDLGTGLSLKEVRDNWDELLAVAANKDANGFLKYEVVKQSKWYLANKEWVKWLQKNGFSIIDIKSDNYTFGGSAFFDMELDFVF